MLWPLIVGEFLQHFQTAFTKPTLQRMGDLLVAALLKTGNRTLSGILAFSQPLLSGHYSSFYRLFSRPVWSNWSLARILATLLIDLVPSDQPVVIVADATVNEHPGRKVYGKAKHRDAIHSSQAYNAVVWGHRWIVLAVAVSLPGITRAWALPLLMALYRTPELSQAQQRPHKTPVVLLRQLVNVLLRWFPDRRFVLVVDGEFSSHQLAGYARRHRRQLTLIGKFYPRAALYATPDPSRSGQRGRRAEKGQRLPTPEQFIQGQARRAESVSWYGGTQRQVGLSSSCGLWHRSGQGLVWLKWVHVEDLEGTHRSEYFFSTDPALSNGQVVGYYTLRWSLEVTFQESRAHLGWGSRRVWSQESVLRSDPWLLMLYSVVSYLYLQLKQRGQDSPVASFAWYAKSEATFSDALRSVRVVIWEHWLKHSRELGLGVQQFSPPFRDFLLFQLTLSV